MKNILITFLLATAAVLGQPTLLNTDGTGMNNPTFRNAVLPSQSTHSGKYLRTDGAGTVTWEAGAGGFTGGTTADLRTIRVNGYNSLAAPAIPAWRMAESFRRNNYNANPSYQSRFRLVTLGDSNAVNMQTPMQSMMGYGGDSVGVGEWAAESVAVTTAQEEWTRCPNAQITTINAGTVGGTYIEKLNFLLPFNSVLIHYLSSSTTGSFRLDYKINKTGSWIPSTSATVSAGGGSVVSGVINTNNGGAEKYSLATIDLPSGDIYSVRIQAVTGSGNAPVNICMTVLNSGGFDNIAVNQNRISGAVGIDFARGGKGLSSNFALTPQNVWTDAMAAINPNLIVYRSTNQWSLAGYTADWNAYAARIRAAAPNALFVVCGMHPNSGIPTRTDATSLAIDDYLREWCAANDSIFVDLMQSFPAYLDSPASVDDLFSDGIHVYDQATPNWGGGAGWIAALVLDKIRPALDSIKKVQVDGNIWSRVVPGFPTEIHLTSPSQLAGETVDLYKGVFTFVGDTRATQEVVIRDRSATFNSGFHRWTGTAGFGKEVSGTAATASLLYFMSNGTKSGILGTNGAIFGNWPTANRAGNGYRFLGSGYNHFRSLIAEGFAAQTGSLLAIDVGATPTTNGTPLWSWYKEGLLEYEGGPGVFGAATATVNAGVVENTITIVNAGQNYNSAPTISFTGSGTGAVATAAVSGGMITGITVSSGGTGYTTAPTVVITPVAVGDDANETFFTHGNPTADTFIHTPAQSGTVAVIVSNAASLNYGSIAALGEETLTITVTGALTTNTPSVELGWSAALETGIVVKQAWVSATNTVSVRVANITAGAIDPVAITCRATVDNF